MASDRSQLEALLLWEGEVAVDAVEGGGEDLLLRFGVERKL
jgi:hypothetical protein